MVSIPAIITPFIVLGIWSLLSLKGNPNKSKKLKHKRIVLVGIIPPLLCLVLLGINEYNSDFNLERWSNKANDRVYMIDDLLDKYEFKGMTQTKIYKLLGNPDSKTDNTLIYFLGNERGLVRIDSEQLMIKLNEENVVIDHRVTTN